MFFQITTRLRTDCNRFWTKLMDSRWPRGYPRRSAEVDRPARLTGFERTGGAMEKSSVSFFRQDSDSVRQFSSAVCLHGHTMHSEECLSFLPRYLHHVPGISQIAGACQRDNSVDFARAYWTPPLTPVSALTLEQEQIAGFGL